jgi:catalase (peroxidase I)
MQVRKGSGVQPQVGGVPGKFVADFVSAWSKVTDLDRFDVA